MKFAVCDIESENFVRFKTIGFYDGDEFRHFESIEKFIQHIDRRKYDGWRIYAHYGGKFDFLFLLDQLLEKSNLKFMERQGRIISLRCILPRGNRILFCDSYAMLPASLEKLTIAFNVKHKKLKFDFDAEKKIRLTKKLLTYLEHDCIGLYEVLESFFGMDFIGSPQLTIASQAMHTFTHHFLDCDLLQTKPTIEQEFRSQYYSGGRVEVFKGIGKVNCYDVNSLFPYVMLQEMPVGKPKETRTFHKGKIGFYTVRIQSTPDFYIPPYLLKVKRGAFSKNYFVNGKGEYAMSSAMLNHLRDDYGVRFTVLNGYVFPDREEIFSKYVNHWYAIKRSHKGDALEQVSKLMLNSLYGRFAMTRMRESIETFAGQSNWQIPDNSLLHEFGLVLVNRESKNKFILPYLASYITDLARLHHWKLMQMHPREMFYCDTDSLFTSAEYPHGKDIGELDFKGRFDAVFFGAKSYALKNRDGERVLFKGFKPDKFSFDDLKNALTKGTTLETEEQRVASFRESLNLKSGRVLESQGRFLNLIRVKKTVQAEYDKRIMTRSKAHFFDTKAFTYQEMMEESS